jgi:hypothetical protein
VVDEIRERLAVNKQRSHRFHMLRFNLRKLNEVEGREYYCFGVSSWFAALENFDAELDINSTWLLEREYENISKRESRLL